MVNYRNLSVYISISLSQLILINNFHLVLMSEPHLYIILWTLNFFVYTLLFFLFIALMYRIYYIQNQAKTRLRKKDAALNKLIEEKEWLIGEIHHRVKNNLQIVMSLLQRQSSFIDNKEALEAIKNSEHRMQSIALLHQKLYQSDDLSFIDMAGYINELVNYLKDCFEMGERINFIQDIQNIQLEISQAVPLGLILNESISNALKYGFPGDKQGIVKVLLHRIEPNYFLLEITDNGVGVSDILDLEKNESLGMTLIKGLSKQINGKLEIESELGFQIRIRFGPYH
jgi:two-component sensor histidine kinase